VPSALSSHAHDQFPDVADHLLARTLAVQFDGAASIRSSRSPATFRPALDGVDA
jgi:hypothetical protein